MHDADRGIVALGAAYVARGEARVAYKRAFAAQLAIKRRHAIDRLNEARPRARSRRPRLSFSLWVLTLDGLRGTLSLGPVSRVG